MFLVLNLLGMKQLFLTSSVNIVAKDIATRLNTVGKKLVFIDTAAEVKTGDKTWLVNDRKSLVDIGFLVTDYTISGKTKEELVNDLDDYDVIYMCGGDSLYLLQQSQLSGFIEVIRDLVNNQGKTYIGTSAGTVVTGPNLYPTYRLTDATLAPLLNGFKGFGLVNFLVLPHWGSEHFKDKYLNSRLEQAYSVDQVPLIALTDNQYVHIQDDRMEIITL